MTSDVREQLAANTKRRTELEGEKKALEDEEKELIALAWRQNLPPREIATLAGRSGAHIRKLRPEDVPPAKRGGTAYVPEKKSRSRTK